MLFIAVRINAPIPAKIEVPTMSATRFIEGIKTAVDSSMVDCIPM
jgi:hypothetical protein